MRFNRAAVAVLLGASIPALHGLPTCDITSATYSEWYPVMMYCAYDATGLEACIANGSYAGPTRDSVLPAVAIVSGSPQPACKVCLDAFWTSVHALVTGAEMADCGGSTFSALGVQTSSCLLLLSDIIDTFNACASNGKDIITGSNNYRCHYDPFRELERDFLPYGSMVNSARAGVLLGGYQANVGSSFPLRLSNIPCGSCFDPLYSAISSVPGLSSNCANPFATSCLTALSVPLHSFMLCTGGFALHVATPARCSISEKKLVEDAFRPYKALVACSQYNTLLEESNFRTCMDQFNALEEAPPVECNSCFSALEVAIDSEKSPECDEFPSAGTCVDSLNGLYGALGEFSVCAGFDLDTTPTECSNVEWSLLSTRFTSYTDLFLEAISASSELTASTILANDVYLADMQSSVSDLNCYSCFNAFASDVYHTYTSSETVQSTCQNVYSEDCYSTSLTDSLNRFTACAGYSLFYEFPPQKCSAKEISLMASTSTSNAVVDIGLTTDTMTTLSMSYTAALLPITANITTDCSFCYVNLARGLFRLTTSQKSNCSSDWVSVDCRDSVTPLIDAFSICSGYALELFQPATTTEAPVIPTTTTSEPASTTMTPEPITTTAIPTATTAIPKAASNMYRISSWLASFAAIGILLL